MLYTDGSVNTKSKIGYGAYLAVCGRDLSTDSLKKRIRVRRFEDTSSSKLELQTLLWALQELHTEGKKLIIYTDSQNIIGLPGRRNRFERHDYFTKKNKRIANFRLYQEFYEAADTLDYELVKVQGHKASHRKDFTDRLFTLVDKASRQALRADAGGTSL